MSGRTIRLLCSVALAAALAAPGVASAQYGGGGDAAAAESAEQKDGEKKRRSWGRKEKKGWGGAQLQIDERTGKRLLEAREHLLADRYDEADDVLDKLRIASLNDLEKAQTYRIRAFVAFGRGDYEGARGFLEQTIAEGSLTPADAADVRFQIAQLYLQEERWADAASSLEQWFTMVEEPNSAAYYLLALTYYQLEELDKALVPARKAVDLSASPKEGWLQLLLALLLTRKEYPAAVPVIEQLVEHYPKKSYYLNLSTVHGALENYEEALVPLQLAYTQGLLTEHSELTRLAQLMLYLELPYRAALVMQTGLETGTVEGDAAAWEMLSNSWIGAREYDKAVEPLERAAERSDGGDLYIRLAQVHIQREKWAAAAAALQRGLSKGGLENPGDAQLLMGIAFYSQKRPEQALSWFTRAREHAATRAEAEVWIQHVGRELPTG